jgi:hypothetical protein
MSALSPLQLRILSTLARYDGELAVIEVANECMPTFASRAEEEAAGANKDTFLRDRGFAIRRAIWRLRDRGLVEETWIEAEWSWRGRTGRYHHRQELLAAARLTPEGEALLV